MDKTENNLAKRLPGINDHNSFAKITKNLFDDDFIFSNCWYERINGDRQSLGQSPSEAGGQSSAWQAISSCRFKNVVFKRDGTFEKYFRKHIEKSANYEDFEEFGRTISIYRGIFLDKATSKIRSYVEKECREVFYEREISNKINNYKCIHNKRKYCCKDCGGSQICQHNKRKYYCKLCLALYVWLH